MISTQSKLTSNSRFLQNFLLSIKSSKKILIFISVLHLLGAPLLAVLLIYSSTDSYDIYYSNIYAFIIISVFCLGVAVLCGIFIALNNFSYLYKKSEVDMVCSLPIKRKTKFLSDYLSGAAVYLVPYIIASLIADIILIIWENFTPAYSMYIADDYHIIPLILQFEFAGLLCMLMLYTLSVLVICCCGTLFESLVNILLVNAVIPGSIAVISGLFFANLYGISIMDSALSVIGYSSPCGAVIYYFNSSGKYLEFSESQTSAYLNIVPYGKWVLLFLLFTAAYFLLSMFLYQKRKAEDTSKPYVFKLLYYIFLTVIMMGISLIARLYLNMIIPVIVFSLIIYLIFEVITNRGFKKIYRSLIKYAVTMVCILAACVLSSLTHGFGIENLVFSPSLVKSVEVGYDGIDSCLSEVRYNYNSCMSYSVAANFTFECKDKEMIKTITDIQKQAIDTYREGKYEFFRDQYTYSYTNSRDNNNDKTDLTDFPTYILEFKFNLKTGGSATRYYILTFEQLKKLFVLDKTEEFADMVKETIINVYPNEIKAEFTNDNERYILTYTRLLYEYDGGSNDMTLTADEAEKLKECYKQDYLEASYEDFTTSEIVCYLNYNIPLRKCFKRTIDFIKSKGGLDLYASPYYMSNKKGVLYSPKGYKSWGRNDVTASFGIVETLDSYSHGLNADQTTQLIKCSRSHYIEQADCYVLNVDGNYYVIPYGYTDVAEKIYNEPSGGKNSYTFEDLENDVKACSNPEDYMLQHLKDDFTGNKYFYDDICKIFEVINSNETDKTYEQIDDSESENDNERAYYLLSNFFGFSSYEEYTDYYHILSYDEWEEYTEEFPQICNPELNFYNYIE